MGNCQAVDAAALVIQHPCGKIERLYWSVPASEVMKTNPGHYVSLIIPLPVSEAENDQEKKTVRFTRVKLLRPNETLNLGHAYRLITNQEVMKVLRAKKHAKTKKPQQESIEKSKPVPDKKSSDCEAQEGKAETAKIHQAPRTERHRQRMASAAMRSKSWLPSLQSISESSS
ncbi:D-ribose-binding periplasmic protein [Quillaja saponaria]|uniref:D-ribose-binding periplasmic protein n=1 Tax=Quillaja saponaria TaxID=32244 RepID=A0AAD7PG55_QUISA|nr:D-ribose-binding periplasmic protein [Quillaja saponaria]